MSPTDRPAPIDPRQHVDIAQRGDHRVGRPGLRPARARSARTWTPRPSASLAADGLRYNRFHVTSLCSPTRAALLAGRNHHAVGMGFLSDLPLVYPGYRGAIPPTAATLPRILRDAGYTTLAVGKWHLAPAVGVERLGPVRPLAARAGLRALLRLPGRRHQPVDPVAGARQQRHRSAPHPRAGLPPDRGPGRPGPAHAARPAPGHARPALLPVLRHRRHPRPAPGPARRGSSATAAPSTTAGRRSASGPSTASSTRAWCPPGTDPARPSRLGGRRGRS